MWTILGGVLVIFAQIVIAEENDRCMEKMDPGPCQYYQVKWFWDPKYERCNEFHYGGCLGTRNRFNTKQECVKQCIFKEHNPASIPDLCLLDPDPGHCGDERHGQWWYFFNAVSGVCEQFFFYGCGGNHNKFYSLYQCRKVCGERLSPQIACDRCDVRTSTCQQNSKYNYTCECRDGFQKNEHNECVDIDECRQGKSECAQNAWCENTVGGHKCTCMAGYVGDGNTCTYVGVGKSVDDCTLCSSDATCSNGVCQCKVGFMGDGYNCSDTDECKRTPNPCDPMATCKNNEGSFTCTCPVGYAGNGYNCTKITKSCLDKFDRDYQESCGLENWREHYYLDHTSKRCSLFWYDGCPGKSYNIFSDLQTCENMCERTHVLTRAVALPVVLP
uniref:Kunitz/Bovine pancreatic trypsin inhibitor domain protein n=1 Tax=Panagrellus redivivus TaxID=6233 RepID=A0A7E4V8R0_PANRE